MTAVIATEDTPSTATASGERALVPSAPSPPTRALAPSESGGNKRTLSALVPTTFAEAETLGEVFARSGFFNDARQAAQAITKVVAGRELGLGAMASMLGFYIVKGRPAMSANLMAAVIQNARGDDGHFRFRFRVPRGKHTKASCTIEYEEWSPEARAWEYVGESTFDMDDAKAAGLQSSDNYKKFPRNMLFARAMSNGAKWYCPGAFAGQTPYTPDELDGRAQMREDGEYVADGTVVQPGEVILDAEVVTAVPPANLEELQTLLAETQTDPARVYNHFKASSVAALTASQVTQAITLLQQKQSAMLATAPVG